MSKPPPDDLMKWSKAALVKELGRLRAVMREHAEQPHDPATSGGDMVDVAGDPYARGGVVLDARGAVLMENIDVSLIDTNPGDPPAMFLLLGGRVNYEMRRVSQAYMFGPDGAAGLATQLIALAARAGREFFKEFHDAFDQRMSELP